MTTSRIVASVLSLLLLALLVGSILAGFGDVRIRVMLGLGVVLRLLPRILPGSFIGAVFLAMAMIFKRRPPWRDAK